LKKYEVNGPVKWALTVVQAFVAAHETGPGYSMAVLSAPLDREIHRRPFHWNATSLPPSPPTAMQNRTQVHEIPVISGLSDSGSYPPASATIRVAHDRPFHHASA